MKVCVFGGTNPATNPKFFGVAKEMGELLVKNDFDMVWGGNRHGVLSKIYDKYLEEDKSSTLFMPKAYENDLVEMSTNKVVKVNSVLDRLQAMLVEADACLVMPGGIGTIHEFWAAVEVRRAEECTLEIILLNYKNFYKTQIEFFDFINKNGFTKTGAGGSPYKVAPEKLFKIAKTPQEAIDMLINIKNDHRPKCSKRITGVCNCDELN